MQFQRLPRANSVNLCELNKVEWVIAVPHNIIGPKQKYTTLLKCCIIMLNRMLQTKLQLFTEMESKNDAFLI